MKHFFVFIVATAVIFQPQRGSSVAFVAAGYQLKSGLKMEAVAQEPAIESPVAFEWDAGGRLWVVEMCDYPEGGLAGKKGQQPVSDSRLVKPITQNLRRNHDGRVVVLEDTKKNGVYDKATVFLDQLSYPNGIYPSGKGVIVSADGEIFYAETTNGDGRADVRKTLLSGFGHGNPQHRVNGFDYVKGSVNGNGI
jgi:glucose/arabinose dehydrogenase